MARLRDLRLPGPPVWGSRAEPAGAVEVSSGIDLPAFRITIFLCVTEKKISGKPISDDQIQAWADEAEAGYSVDRLRRRGRKPLGDGPSDVVPVRIEAELLQALTERAKREDVTRSEAIRAAVRAWVGVA